MQDEGVRLKPATEQDLPTVASLAATIWREHYPGIITHAQIDYMLERSYDIAVMRREIAQGGIRYDLCLAGDTPVGFIAYGPGPAAGELKVHKLYLLGTYHGQGLGHRMLQQAASYAAEHGYHTVILAVNKQNAKAIAAYERNGFTIREAVLVDIGKGFVMDDYIMEQAVADTQ